MKGFIARDRDGALFFHSKLPKRFYKGELAYWVDGDYRFMISRTMEEGIDFELPTWEDGPFEVELKFELT